MNDLDFFEELEAALGGNLVDVELTEDDYLRAFNRAKRVYKQRGNDNMRRSFQTISIIAEQVDYTVDPLTNEIMQLIKPSGFSSDNPFTQAMVNDFFGGIRSGNVGGDLATYELSSQMIENLEIYTANATPYHFDRIGKTIKLLDVPTVSENWILDTHTSLTDNEYRDKIWIYDWSLSELKITLGRAYSKFSSLSSPTGETSLDGQTLIQEGREDQVQLLEDIKNHVDGDPVGMPIMMG